MAVHPARDLNGKPSEPGLENLRTFWQMTDRRKKSITCALYRTIGGLELRAGHGEGDRLLCQRVYTELAAEVFAAAWKAAAEAKGFRES